MFKRSIHYFLQLPNVEGCLNDQCTTLYICQLMLKQTHARLTRSIPSYSCDILVSHSVWASYYIKYLACTALWCYRTSFFTFKIALMQQMCHVITPLVCRKIWIWDPTHNCNPSPTKVNTSNMSISTAVNYNSQLPSIRVSVLIQLMTIHFLQTLTIVIKHFIALIIKCNNSHVIILYHKLLNIFFVYTQNTKFQQ